ncbi:hypothetical protein BJX99DRAFT_226766 [Aspergillus californicus]
MGVPFEALLPYGIVVVMFGVTGAGLSVVKSFANDGKKARWNRDLWDRVRIPTDNQWCKVMDRDLRLTGKPRGQSTEAEAPRYFEVLNPWKVEKRLY